MDFRSTSTAGFLHRKARTVRNGNYCQDRENSPVFRWRRKGICLYLQSLRTSELLFRVGGSIDRFEVYAGNYYPQGSVIVEIDPRDFRIRKERTEAVYTQMRTEFERIQKLYEKNNISSSQYEKTRADYIAVKTAFATASNELEDSRLIAPFNGYVSEVYIEKLQDVRAAQPVLSL